MAAPSQPTQDLAAMDLAELQARLTLEAAQEHRASATAAVEGTQGALDSRATERAWEVVGWTATADAGLSTQRAEYTQRAVEATQQAAQAQAQGTATRSAQEAAVSATFTAQAFYGMQTAEASTLRMRATQEAAEASKAALEVERGELTNRFLAWWKLATWPLLLLGMVVLGMWGVRMGLENRVIGRDGNGQAPVVMVNGRLVNVDRTLYPVIDVRSDQRPLLEAQVRITENEQRVQMMRAHGHHHHHQEPSPYPLPMGEGGEGRESISLPESAPWRLVEDWQGGAMPIGIGKRGLIYAANDMAPHLLVAGTSGSGKTFYGLRPVTALALGGGWTVVIISRNGHGYEVFEGRPNAHLVRLERAEEAAGILKMGYLAVQERLRAMGGSAYAWGEWAGRPAPMTLIVMDEFSNLADELEAGEREELWRWARMIAAEGRKAGIILALALQDPTARSIDLRIRRNCTRWSFRVQDEAASRVVLGAAGAEKLGKGQFLAYTRSLEMGVGFGPTDEEIRAYLERRPVQEAEKPEWIEAEWKEVDKSPEIESRVRELLREGRSLAEIQREVYGYTGGQAYERVKRITDGITTTTALSGGCAA